MDGSDCWALPLTDPRTIPVLPPGSKGSSTQFSFDGTKCDFAHMDDNGWTLIVHDGAQDNVISVNKTTHAISIIQKDGSAIELKAGEINIRNGSATVSINGSKVQVLGDFGVTGSISQVGGRPLVFADTLIALLTTICSIIDGKLPNPAIPSGATPASPLVPAAAIELATLKTLAN
jgi:uncharacterized Zn-binding protein involved in type VI secretion